MKPAQIRPRPDLVAELIRGFDIPLPALPELPLRYILKTITTVWAGLAADRPAILIHGGEALITAHLEARLCHLEDARWQQLVHSVVRGKETTSYDGSHLEKRPDLAIHLTGGRSPLFPFVVECKVIDLAKRKGADLYLKKGLARFLAGEYAWATREALLLAYVRDGSSIADALTPILEPDSPTAPPPYAIQSPPIPFGPSPPDLARSVHGRSFRYPACAHPGNDPGAITIWHLWMPVPVGSSP